MRTLTSLLLSSLVLVCLSLWIAGCSDSGEQSFSIEIEDHFSDLITSAQEEEIAKGIERYNKASYRATVLINSTLFADFERTDWMVIEARAEAAMQAIDELVLASAELITLENNYILPAMETIKARPRAKIKADGDLYHAMKLIDLYMNDPNFYKKYKLSDIAKRTGVSMTRLRMMMEQVKNEIITAGYVDLEEQYTKATRNCKAIRDTAITAEGVLVTIATGGAGAAGTLTTVQKGVQIIEGVSTVVSVAESGVNVVNAAMGTDEKPPVIDAIFTGNKVVSYLLLPKNLLSKDVGSVIAITGPIDDATDWYFNVDTSSGTVNASTTPNNPGSNAIHPDKQDILDDLLLPGDYQLPKKQLVGPNKDNSGFSFVDDVQSDDDLLLDAINMADLWDLPGAPQDTMSWDTESMNPAADMEHASSQGPDESKSLLEGDSLLFDPQLADPPAVTVSASPQSGDAPLIVTFNASVENPSGEALTYEWFYGGRAYEKSALPNPDHTFDEPGTYRVTVYVEGAQLGKLMGAITVEVGEAAGDQPDGDDPGGTEGRCYSPAGIYCPADDNGVDTGVVMCNPVYNVEQVCSEVRPGRSVFAEVQSCDDGNPLTWDDCSEVASDCSAHCTHADWSGTNLTVDKCFAGYRDRWNMGENWCIEDVMTDDDGNPTLYPVQGIYACSNDTTITLVAACPCYYDWDNAAGPYCYSSTPYPYGEY